MEPLPSVLAKLAIDASEHGKFAHALALRCFISIQCDPLRYVEPFAPLRVKGVLLVAKILSQVAPHVADGTVEKICQHQGLALALSRTDLVSLCEAALLLVMRWGPMGSPQYVVDEAREMLQDIEKLEGRNLESSLLRAWASARSHSQGVTFFRTVVLESVQKVAGFALEITETSTWRRSVKTQ